MDALVQECVDIVVGHDNTHAAISGLFTGALTGALVLLYIAYV